MPEKVIKQLRPFYFSHLPMYHKDRSSLIDTDFMPYKVDLSSYRPDSERVRETLLSQGLGSGTNQLNYDDNPSDVSAFVQKARLGYVTKEELFEYQRSLQEQIKAAKTDEEKAKAQKAADDLEQARDTALDKILGVEVSNEIKNS